MKNNNILANKRTEAACIGLASGCAADIRTPTNGPARGGRKSPEGAYCEVTMFKSQFPIAAFKDNCYFVIILRRLNYKR